MTRASLVLAVAVALAMPVTPARALPVTVVTTFDYQYVPGHTGGDVPLQITQGGRLLYVNADYFGWHTVTSFATDRNGDPRFTSDWIGLGEASWVDGVEALAPGTYPFYCTTHGTTVMSGVLEVVPPPI